MKLKFLVLVFSLAFVMDAQAGEVDAQLEWARRVELGTLVSGVVTEASVGVGDKVVAGQVLLRLDQRAFRARLDEARAKAKNTELELSEAKRELERAQELYNRTVLSDHDLVEAKIAFGKSELAALSAATVLAQAEVDFQYSEVRAPFDAIVLRKNAEVGQVIVVQLQASPLLIIAERGTMLARAEVDAETANNLTIGIDAKIRIGKVEYSGKLRTLGLEAAGMKGGATRYEALFVFQTKNEALRAGQAARIDLSK